MVYRGRGLIGCVDVDSQRAVSINHKTACINIVLFGTNAITLK